MLGLGSEDENLGAGGGTSQQAYATIVTLDKSEGPGGSHYDNLTGPTRLWAGVSTATEQSGTVYTDSELVIPHGTVQFLYPVTAQCPVGTTVNNS